MRLTGDAAATGDALNTQQADDVDMMTAAA